MVEARSANLTTEYQEQSVPRTIGEEINLAQENIGDFSGNIRVFQGFDHIVLTPVISTCPLHINSRCGKERRTLIGPW